MAEGGVSRPSQSPTAVKDHTDAGIEIKDKPRQIRRRNRIIASCLPCRQRKIRCDKLNPCSNCKKFSRQCLYIAPALDTVAQQELAELKDKLSHLEESLGRDVIRRAQRSDASRMRDCPGNDFGDFDDIEDDSHAAEDERNLKPTPLAVFDQLYDDDADDEIMDLGIAMGKMRVSERIGGLVRPKLADELQASIESRRISKDIPARPQVFRQSFAFGSQNEPWQSGPAPPESYLAPGPSYIAPATDLVFPNIASSPSSLGSLGEFLPSRTVSDQLVAQYLLATHPIARVVHRPTFEKQYVIFWDCFNQGTSPPAPIQAIIFASMLCAAVSMSDNLALQLTGMPKSLIVERLRTTTEMSLSRAHFLQTTKIDTLQAFVMYMIPLCHNEISRSHSALIGAAIRLAQCMGLHRDGTLYGFSAVDTHVRRLIWYQICYLDIRTAECTGPRPQIRRDEYDTKFPLHVNDEDLSKPSPPTEDSTSWTEMTFTRMKIECYDLIRQLWDDMPRMDRKKTTLTATLVKIQRFRASTGAKYMAMLQNSIPLHLFTRQAYRALSNRAFVIILQRYIGSQAQPMPERLRQMLIEASICCTEAGINLDTQPMMSNWSWYRPSILQYHAALILLLQVHDRPEMKEAARIWACMDYVFELQPNHTPREKAEAVLMELRDRLGVYQNMRKVKASTDIEGSSNRSVTNSPVAKVTVDSSHNFAKVQATIAQAPVMQPTTYNSPESSTGSRAGNAFSTDMAGDASMQVMPDIDWIEWEEYFPQGAPSQSILGNIDIPADFDMGSFLPHNSYHGLEGNLRR